MNRYFAEFIGTFFLVFAGTAAIAVNSLTAGSITHVGICIVFGLTVMTMIYSLGEISGAHFNPAVTFAFCLAKRLPFKEWLPYSFSQSLGALCASTLLKLCFSSSTPLGVTSPQMGVMIAVIFEILMSCLLMLIILSVSTGAQEKGITAGIAIGSGVALCALLGGPVSGASMNPARSLAPALLSAQLHDLWIYLTAPFIGTSLAVLICRFTHSSSSCCGGKTEGAKS